MPTPATFQSPPTAIPEPPAFPSLMETQSPDAYFQAGFWDAWGIWIILASILLAVAIAVIVLIRRKGRIPAAPLSPSETAIRDISMLRNTHPSLRQAAVETFRQNVLDVYMDCPSRERGGWLCDSFFTSRIEKLLTGSSRVK